MITSKLRGGLGNQMFQIAAALSLGKDLGIEVAFDHNQHYLPNQGNKSTDYSENIFWNNEKYIRKVFSIGEMPLEFYERFC